MPKTEKQAAPAAENNSKLAGFLSSKKLDARRVLAASDAIEKLRPEDRAIRLLAKQRRKGDAPKDKNAEKVRPRSGRPVTPRAMSAALSGGKVAGPMKTRILRAVNRLLEQKKQDAVTFDALF
ncbi:MAG: hypothetical protein IT374_12505 [Polyangiaceae bacterium]|nr:hypothetical protein [Polyangiaceae bacterium]